jgi:hypothetical protein
VVGGLVGKEVIARWLAGPNQYLFIWKYNWSHDFSSWHLSDLREPYVQKPDLSPLTHQKKHKSFFTSQSGIMDPISHHNLFCFLFRDPFVKAMMLSEWSLRQRPAAETMNGLLTTTLP